MHKIITREKFYRILIPKCIYFNGSLINFLTTYFREINLKLHRNGSTKKKKKKLYSEQADWVFDPKFRFMGNNNLSLLVHRSDLFFVF